MNQYSPGAGTIFIGPSNKFPQYNNKNFHVMFSDFISRPQYRQNPNLEEWKHILEFGGTAHTQAIVANIKFCRNIIGKPYNPKHRMRTGSNGTGNYTGLKVKSWGGREGSRPLRRQC
jgi:hypothetical protein